MAVDDVWYRAQRGPGGERVPTAKHGRGRRFRVRYVDDVGQRRDRMFTRKVDAERFDAQIRADVSRGTYIAPAAGRVTFGECAQKWAANAVHRPGTRLQAETHLRRHVLPVLGARAIQSIRPTDVQGLVRGLADKLAPSTIEVIYAYVRATFAAAVADRLILASPCGRMITRPKVEPKRVKPIALDALTAIREMTAPRFRALVTLLPNS